MEALARAGLRAVALDGLRDTAAPLPSVEVALAAAPFGGRYLHFGYPEQETNGPKRPIRFTRSWPQSGHFSPVSSAAGRAGWGRDP